MRRYALLLSLALLAACSSGGGGGGGSGNQAPSFTSGTTASVVENSAGAAYQASATDPDGNPVTFSIAGGADSARFTITAGALSFGTPPNFDAPQDTGADNVYDVQLSASDGSLSSTLNLAVTVTNSREGIAVRRVGTGFDQPISVAAIPDSSDVLVAERTGNIFRLNPANGSKTLLLTVQDLTTDGERGLLGVASRPEFATNSRIVVHCTGLAGDVEIRGYQLAASTVRPPLWTLSTPHPGANNHNGGFITFGPDGNIYVGIGDGGGSGDPANNAQDPNIRLGKILRIFELEDPYVGASVQPFIRAATGNPFSSADGDPYVFALGLRNPFRASFGPDGRLYIGDVGQGAVEEIDVVRPDQPGLNFGWNFLEGTTPFTGTAPAGLTAPVSQYAHGTGPREGSTIIGGYVYRGPIASLTGSYVFADYISNNIWSVPSTSLVQGSLYPAGSYERRNLDFTPDAGTIEDIVSFGEDAAGNLFIVDIGGEVFMVVPG